MCECRRAASRAKRLLRCTSTNGHLHGEQRVAQAEARVGQRAGIDDRALHPAGQRLDGIDQLAFVIGLQPLELDAQHLGVGPQHRLDLGQRRTAVDLRLALSQEVEVGTIENREAHDQRLRFCSQSWNWSRSSSPPAPGGAPAGRGVVPGWAGPPP